jgi:hypothetical protein
LKGLPATSNAYFLKDRLRSVSARYGERSGRSGKEADSENLERPAQKGDEMSNDLVIPPEGVDEFFIILRNDIIPQNWSRAPERANNVASILSSVLIGEKNIRGINTTWHVNKDNFKATL